MADVSEISTNELYDSTIETIRRRRRRMLHRVPPQIRAHVNRWVYDPEMFQFGAYNYLQQKKVKDQLNINLQAGEQLKNEILNIMLESASKDSQEVADKGFFISKFLKHVDEFRHFYGGLSKDDFSDQELADMMLRDACFVLYFLWLYVGDDGIMEILGPFGIHFARIDIFKLENQIPLSAVKLLFTIIHKETTEAYDQWKAFLCNALSPWASAKDIELKRVPWGQEEPLHFLEALRAVKVKLSLNQQEQEYSNIGQTEGNYCPIIYKILKWMGFSCHRQKRSNEFNEFEAANQSLISRSVTELKAKGILLRPSGSRSFKDVNFVSYGFFGILELPTYRAFDDFSSTTFISNLIALEMSPGNTELPIVAAYVSFMKSLIQSPKDVRELREKGILFWSGDDQQLMNVFKEITIYPFQIISYIVEIKATIEDHCNNRWKTWIAELINSKFATPWSAIALFSAILLLCLTFLQTIYTMKQSK